MTMSANDALNFLLIGPSGLALDNKNSLYVASYAVDAVFRLDLELHNMSRVAGSNAVRKVALSKC